MKIMKIKNKIKSKIKNKMKNKMIFIMRNQKNK